MPPRGVLGSSAASNRRNQNEGDGEGAAGDDSSPARQNTNKPVLTEMSVRRPPSPAKSSSSEGGGGGSASSCSACENRLPHQEAVREFYQRGWVQGLVAVLIVGNFIVTVIEKEIDPFEPELQYYEAAWSTIDHIFTWAFVVELLVNMYGSWLCAFWYSGWNVFDFFIVLVSVLASAGALQGPLKLLKVLRAFRVFRLFKRIKALNKIITALIRAIPGVTNAFVIMLIIMSMYAIIGVEIFSTFGEDGTFLTLHATRDLATNMMLYPNVSVSAETMRGLNFGQEYFGSFSRALFTMFQVLTGESWAEMVARPLIFGNMGTQTLGASFFFSSYIVIMQIVLINVVVAVLLDKFVEEEPAPAGAEGEEGEGGEGVPSVAQTEGLGSDGRAPCASFAPATAVDATESKANTSKANTARIAGAGVLPPPGAVSSGSLGAGGGSGGGVEGQLHALRADMKSMAAKLETVSSMRQQIERLAQSLDATAAAVGGAKGAPEARAGGARSEKGSDSNRSDSLLKA
jgi:hypothetical protein